MDIVRLAIPEVIEMTPTLHQDRRGHFYETFNLKNLPFLDDIKFVQFMESYSHKGVVRGLHFQDALHAQAKLVRVTQGKVFDVAVDVRKDSPTYGGWVGVELSSYNNKSLFIPKGFAHGFMALENDTKFIYAVDDYWHSGSERCLKWDDKKIGIEWPKLDTYIVSDKDKNGSSLKELDSSFKY